MRERMQLIGFVGAPGGPDDYTRVLRAQIDTMATLVRDAGLRGR